MSETLKDRAILKMMGEMTETHSAYEDVVHNWLCDQEDDPLFAGVLTEGKTIKQAWAYCYQEASKVKQGNVAMISDDTVFQWVRDYFLKQEEPIQPTTPPNPNKVTSQPMPNVTATVSAQSTAERGEEEQLSLFDML